MAGQQLGFMEEIRMINLPKLAITEKAISLGTDLERMFHDMAKVEKRLPHPSNQPILGIIVACMLQLKSALWELYQQPIPKNQRRIHLTVVTIQTEIALLGL
jgi:hypothetical protein